MPTRPTTPTTIAVSLALAGTLTACGTTPDEPADAPTNEAPTTTQTTDPEPAPTSEPPPAEPTSEEPTSAEPTSEEQEEESDTPSETAGMPEDPTDYLSTFLTAWDEADTTTLEQAAVDEVAVIVSAWDLQAQGWEVEQEADLSNLEGGADLTGYWMTHPDIDGQLVVTLDTTRLGEIDAIVGADLTLAPDIDEDTQIVTSNPVQSYAMTVVEALVDQDEETLHHHATDEVVQTLLQGYDPELTGTQITYQGFYAFQGEPVGVVYGFLDADDSIGEVPPSVLEIDPWIAGAEDPDGVIGTNVSIGERWRG